MENNFDKMQKIAGTNIKMNQLSKLANSMNPIPENIRKIIEMQDKFKLVIPTFDIPVAFANRKFPTFDIPKIDFVDTKFPDFILPKIEIPNFVHLLNYELFF